MCVLLKSFLLSVAAEDHLQATKQAAKVGGEYWNDNQKRP
jgi:hypothetical protein